MAIQWYPGHMHKAQKEIKMALPKVDVVIEVVDARIPYSSTNPAVAEILANSQQKKPVIRLLNKSDLADPEVTKLWCDSFDSLHNSKSLPVSSKQPAQLKNLISLCHKLVPGRSEKGKSINAMIMGIPNVGKSTIINILSGRKIAIVGNEPAVTKRQQKIHLDNNVVLYDTPGFLWPKINNTNSSYRLAVTGAIKDAVIEYDDIAYYAAEYLLKYYPEKLKATYHLDVLPDDVTELLESIGKRRGCLKSGKRVDLDRVCKILIYEFRDFTMGPISLETPEMIERELIAVEEAIRIKAEKDEARKKRRKGKD